MVQSPAERMKAFAGGRKSSGIGNIASAGKDMVRFAPQHLLKSEPDMKVGYEKGFRLSGPAVENGRRNYRNGPSKKTVPLRLGWAEFSQPAGGGSAE